MGVILRLDFLRYLSVVGHMGQTDVRASQRRRDVSTSDVTGGENQ